MKIKNFAFSASLREKSFLAPLKDGVRISSDKVRKETTRKGKFFIRKFISIRSS